MTTNPPGAGPRSEAKDGGAAFPDLDLKITWTRDSTKHECILIDARLYTREHVSKLLRALDILGPDMPSSKSPVLTAEQMALLSARGETK